MQKFDENGSKSIMEAEVADQNSKIKEMTLDEANEVNGLQQDWLSSTIPWGSAWLKSAKEKVNFFYRRNEKTGVPVLLKRFYSIFTMKFFFDSNWNSEVLWIQTNFLSSKLQFLSLKTYSTLTLVKKDLSELSDAVATEATALASTTVESIQHIVGFDNVENEVETVDFLISFSCSV